jgi:alkylhydroperoxidase family enzyme
LPFSSQLYCKSGKIDAVELNDARIAKSADLKTEAVLRFAKILVRKKGMLSEEDIINIRKAGFTDEGIVEIVGHVALNILTNYVNLTAKTDIDFPVVETFSAAVI